MRGRLASAGAVRGGRAGAGRIRAGRPGARQPGTGAVTGRHYAVVAGGGTGGHVLPALAVARALVARGHDQASIEFVGSRRGQEADLLAGDRLPAHPAAGPGHRPSARSARAGGQRRGRGRPGSGPRLTEPWPAWPGAGRGWWCRSAATPRCPAGVAAAVLRVPLVLVNVDAVPGLVHRLLGRFAAASAVAFPGTPLPRAVVTGTPVRAEVRDRRPAPGPRPPRPGGRSASRPTGPWSACSEGRSGPARINEAAAGLARRWADPGRPRPLPRDRPAGLGPGSMRTGRRRRDGRRPVPTGWSPSKTRMDLLYQAADVVVCRAGAITVAELAVAGVPAVLVPLPGAPGRPPDGQRPGPGRPRARPWWCPTPTATRRPARARCSTACWPTPADWRPWAAAARAAGHPDAARPGGRGGGGPCPLSPATATRPTGVDLDLGYRRRIHVVGVGGAGMSAIATVLSAMGHR